MAQKRPISTEGSAVVACVSGPLADLLRKHLFLVPEVDAVFSSTDDNGVVHVYSVVAEYASAIYDKLLKKERLVERDSHGLSLEFHVRAHQGRQPERSVPFEAQPVFVR